MLRDCTRMDALCAAMILVVSTISLGAKGQTPSADHLILSGIVVRTFAYCGGAVPTKAMLAQLGKPEPYPDKRFHLMNGTSDKFDGKIIATFTTNSAGRFSLRLPPGPYLFFLDEQVYDTAHLSNNPSLQLDRGCYDRWRKTPYFEVMLENVDITSLRFDFYQRCFVPDDNPCLSYSGPSPP